MSFTDNVHEVNKSQNSLSPSTISEKKKLPTKTSSRDDEISKMADLWRRLSNQMTHRASNMNNFPKQNGFTVKDKARGFDPSVANILLDCNQKDWSWIKKNNAYFLET